MATTTQSSDLFSSSAIYSAVLTCEKSKVFLRKLIPTAIASIICQRTDYNRVNFKKCVYKNISFYSFEKKVDCEALKELCLLIKGALHAFNNNYLRELYLIFMSSGSSHQILESYKFKFKYMGGDVSSSDAQSTRSDLKKSTIELLKNIENLHAFEDPLKQTKIKIQICLTYYEEITPTDYHPEGFTLPDSDSQNIVETILDMSEKDYILGLLNTGHHTVMCHCKFATELEDLDDNVGSASVDQSQLQSYSSSKKANTELNRDLEKESNNLKIDCRCLISRSFKNIDLVKCTSCSVFEHVPCVGYLYVSDVDQSHCCDQCQCISTISTPENFRRHQLLAIYRLTIVYMYFNKKCPTEILNEVNESSRDHVIKKLSMWNIFQQTQNGYILNKENFYLIEKLMGNMLKKGISKRSCNASDDHSPKKKKTI